MRSEPNGLGLIFCGEGVLQVNKMKFSKWLLASPEQKMYDAFTKLYIRTIGSRAMSPRPCLRRESAQEIDDGEIVVPSPQQQQSRKSLSIFPNSRNKSFSPSPQHYRCSNNFLSPSSSLYKSAPGKRDYDDFKRRRRFFTETYSS